MISHEDPCASIRNSHDDRSAENVLSVTSNEAEAGGAMADRDDSTGDANANDVAVCLRTLNRRIGTARKSLWRRIGRGGANRSNGLFILRG